MSEKVNDLVAAEARYRIAELAARAAGDQLRSLVDRGLEMSPAGAAQVVVEAWRAALEAAVSSAVRGDSEGASELPVKLPEVPNRAGLVARARMLLATSKELGLPLCGSSDAQLQDEIEKLRSEIQSYSLK
ncbi:MULTISPECIES: hypothetical protein [Delftia]|uniref:hypothetical protein n=1 Tax=Delftia TaxID=80865 RepID=UPI00257D2A79|nr:hypothetical protein [Delftia sp.]MPT54777.1 hypothetical protein [Delftia sp.]